MGVSNTPAVAVNQNQFMHGVRDSYGPYALIARPAVPDRSTRGYGGGMLVGGLASIALGVAAPVGYFIATQGMGKGALLPPAVKTGLWVAAGIWAFAHVPVGIAAGFQGARIISTADTAVGNDKPQAALADAAIPIGIGAVGLAAVGLLARR